MTEAATVEITVGNIYVKEGDTWVLYGKGPTAALDARARQLYASVVPADVQRAIDLRQRFARRLRRYDARHDSGPGRRRARSDGQEIERPMSPWAKAVGDYQAGRITTREYVAAGIKHNDENAP